MRLFSLYAMEKADNRLRVRLDRYVSFMATLLNPFIAITRGVIILTYRQTGCMTGSLMQSG